MPITTRSQQVGKASGEQAQQPCAQIGSRTTAAITEQDSIIQQLKEQLEAKEQAVSAALTAVSHQKVQHHAVMQLLQSRQDVLAEQWAPWQEQHRAVDGLDK